MNSLSLEDFYNKLFSLSDREQECLDLVARGIMSKQIAYKLEISEGTVNNFLSRAKRKMCFKNTRDMIKIYQNVRL